MANRVIGIEIGSRKLKAVELEARFGEFTLQQYGVSELPEDFRTKLFGLQRKAVEDAEPSGGGGAGPGTSSEQPQESGEQSSTGSGVQAGAESDAEKPAVSEKPAAPEKLLELGALAADTALGIPNEFCFYREIELPFSDLKKINQVIRLEAEGYFPFSLDDYLVEYLPPSSHGAGSEVLTFVVGREVLASILAQLKSFNLDPAFLGIEGLTLPLLSMKDNAASRLWLDIGDKRSILVGSLGVSPVLYRRLPLGMGELIDSLARELGVSPERAEKYLLETEISNSSSPAAKLMGAWADSLTRRVQETLHWYERGRKGGIAPARFEAVVLCGGGACIPGLDSYFSSALNMAAGRFAVPAWVGRGEGLKLDPDKEPLLAEALSLALARLSKQGKQNLNFRKGEFVYRPQYRIAYRKAAFPAGLLLLMAVLAFAKCGAQYSLVNSQSRQLKQEMVQRYTAIFPSSKPTDPASQLKAQLAAGEARLKAERDLLYPSPVECLAAVGDLVPREIGYVVNRFSYSDNKVRLEGETADFGASKAIVDQLSKVDFFKKVNLEDSRSMPNGKVSFVITIELRNPAEVKSE